MRLIFASALVATLLLPGLALAADSGCFQRTAHDWGGHCDDPKSLELTHLNSCSYAATLVVCFEQAGGQWDCKHQEYVQPGQSATLWSCGNTGNFKIEACNRTEECTLIPR
jgi:hypothetical protein